MHPLMRKVADIASYMAEESAHRVLDQEQCACFLREVHDAIDEQYGRSRRTIPSLPLEVIAHVCRLSLDQPPSVAVGCTPMYALVEDMHAYEELFTCVYGMNRVECASKRRWLQDVARQGNAWCERHVPKLFADDTACGSCAIYVCRTNTTALPHRLDANDDDTYAVLRIVERDALHDSRVRIACADVTAATYICITKCAMTKSSRNAPFDASCKLHIDSKRAVWWADCMPSSTFCLHTCRVIVT